MRVRDVLPLSPHERLIYWINERERVRKNKEADRRKPWTDDVIIQTCRFCNVRRMSDKVSDWLYRNWYRPFYDHKNMVLACTLARQLNCIDSIRAVGYPLVWNSKRVNDVLMDRARRGQLNYGPAYMVTGNHGRRNGGPTRPKPDQTCYIVCDTMYNSNLQINTNSMQAVWYQLAPFPGFGPFIAGQVVADLRWAVKGAWMDKNHWAPLGSGSTRGLNRLADRPLKAVLAEEQFLTELKKTTDYCKQHLDAKLVDRMEAMDYQNCLCEFDKYSRVLLGEGRTKQTYKGTC